MQRKEHLLGHNIEFYQIKFFLLWAEFPVPVGYSFSFLSTGTRTGGGKLMPRIQNIRKESLSGVHPELA